MVPGELKGLRVRGPEDVGDVLCRALDGDEGLVGLAIDANGSVTDHVSLGASPCHGCRPQLCALARVGAPAVILVHGHCWGFTTPTEQDLAMTTAAMAEGERWGVEVLDHIIVAGRSWRSLAESTRLWEATAGGLGRLDRGEVRGEGLRCHSVSAK